MVTSIADTYNHVDDAYALSVREAIDLANTTTAADEIWLGAWKFLLTRQRTNASNVAEMDVSQGDLEIEESLTIRGISISKTTVTWRVGAATDKVFELLGDYNNDGITDSSPSDVDAADYVIWQSGSLAADGNDDGVVNSADYDVWVGHFTHTLMKWGITAA